MLMKIRRSHFVASAVAVTLATVVAGARTRAVQEWYDRVTVEGKVTAYLLDERAAVTGILLDGRQQIRLNPRLGDAIASRVKKGDTVSVIGRGGHATTLGRLVEARAITVNGQTVTLAGEAEAPRGPRGRGGRGPTGGPEGSRDRRGGPPAPAGPGRGDAPPPPPLPDRGALADPGSRELPSPPPEQGNQPGPPDAPPAAAAPPTTVHGTVSTFLIGPKGELRGLVLNTGEQVHFSPRVGEALGAQKSEAHPEVTVVGQVVRSDYGIIVRADQLTLGSQTILVR
jgi:hypothetical protein